jgi:phytoene dehydrogenase-like protein
MAARPLTKSKDFCWIAAESLHRIEAQRTLDYHALIEKIRPVFFWFAGRMNKLVDPWRTPGGWNEALRSDFGGLFDKLRVLRLRARLRASSIEQIFKRPERSTKDALVSAGFSEEFIHRFFRPFFGGILLDGELKSSTRMFEFVFKMLCEGDSVLPARGMGAIPAQLASHLPADAIRLNTHAESLHENELTLTGGESLRARAIVVAAEGPAAAHLVGEAEPASRSVSCFYYSTDEPPVPHPMLVLNGDGAGPVNNFVVMNQVAPSYAPAGKSLVSVTVLGTQQLTDLQLSGFVIAQMKNWFGPVASSWRYLKSYRIPHAQPQQYPAHSNRRSARFVFVPAYMSVAIRRCFDQRRDAQRASRGRSRPCRFVPLTYSTGQFCF